MKNISRNLCARRAKLNSRHSLVSRGTLISRAWRALGAVPWITQYRAKNDGMHEMKVNEGESRAAEVGSRSRPRETACLRSLILFVNGAAQPVVACGPISHKFGNHFCTVSAPIFAVSERGFIDYQRLTTKWEPLWSQF